VGADLVLGGVLGEVMSGGADLRLCLRHRGHSSPQCRRVGHLIDEVDLDVLWHPIQGHVPASLVFWAPEFVELGPCLVPLSADGLRLRAVGLCRAREGVKMLSKS
jgi:hypothetical protein